MEVDTLPVMPCVMVGTCAMMKVPITHTRKYGATIAIETPSLSIASYRPSTTSFTSTRKNAINA